MGTASKIGGVADIPVTVRHCGSTLTIHIHIPLLVVVFLFFFFATVLYCITVLYDTVCILYIILASTVKK